MRGPKTAGYVCHHMACGREADDPHEEVATLQGVEAFGLRISAFGLHTVLPSDFGLRISDFTA